MLLNLESDFFDVLVRLPQKIPTMAFQRGTRDKRILRFRRRQPKALTTPRSPIVVHREGGWLASLRARGASCTLSQDAKPQHKPPQVGTYLPLHYLCVACCPAPSPETGQPGVEYQVRSTIPTTLTAIARSLSPPQAWCKPRYRSCARPVERSFRSPRESSTVVDSRKHIKEFLR